MPSRAPYSTRARNDAHAPKDSASSRSAARLSRGTATETRQDGRPLDPATRQFMEPRFESDFGDVRVHADTAGSEAAARMQARAYTTGSDITFARDQYAPQTTEGRRLIAHELAHVVQQRDAPAIDDTAAAHVSTSAEPHERSAARAAHAVVSGASLVSSVGALGRAPVHIARAGTSQAPAAAAPEIVVPLTDVLPFAPGKLGEPVAWDGQAVVQTAQIDPASRIGKAVVAGPAAVREHADALKQQADASTKKMTDVNDTMFADTVLASASAAQIALSIGTRVARYEDLRRLARLSAALNAPDKSRRQALHAWASQKTPPTGVVGKQPPVPTMRQAVVSELDKWKGATEGVTEAAEGKGKFEDFRTATTLDNARKSAAKEKRGTFTTCIEFLGFVRVNAATQSKSKLAVKDFLIGSNLVKQEMRDKLPPGAWHEASPNMKERPQPGDLFVLTFAEDVYKPENPKKKAFSKGDFSHVGWIRAIKENPTPEGGKKTETWLTVDGGQGQSGKYAYTPENKETGQPEQYKVVQKGKERVDAVARTYDPATNEVVTGEANQPGSKRTLLGWVDVDKIVKQ